jgi:hypothetical protein
MVVEQSDSELRAELKDLEERLTELRQVVRSLRQRIGERWDSPTDMTERAMLVEQAEEQEAFLNTLRARRDDMLRRLGEEPPGDDEDDPAELHAGRSPYVIDE